MKIFTLEEAQNLIPEVKSRLVELRGLYSFVKNSGDAAKSAADAGRTGGGGMEGGSNYLLSLLKIDEYTKEITELGIEIKDYTRGLIDFPFEKNGEIVYLCWQIDDGDEIRWWHSINAGFAGRQKL